MAYYNRPGPVPHYLMDRRRRNNWGYALAGAASAVAATAAKKAIKWSKSQKNQSKSKRRRSGAAYRAQPSLKKKVKELQRIAESDMGTHIYRHKGATRNLSSVGQMTIASLTGVTVSSIEAALAGLRYYNPSTPSSLVTADGTTGSYQKEFFFKRCISKYLCVNNYQVPVKLRMYIVVPKEDTSISPSTAFTNGLTDVGGPSSSSPLVHLTDSEEFGDLYSIVKSVICVLQPGESKLLSYSAKPFQYDPSLIDNHNLSYQRKFGCHTLVTRVEGVLGHDTVANEQGTLAAGVDIQEDRVFEIRYAAGADIKTIAINDTSDVIFTNGGVVSSKPVADNQGYSVA